MTSPLNFRHRAGVRPYTSTFVFAKPCVFDKQSPGPIHCGLSEERRLFSRSYETILPSSLAMIHSSTLGFSRSEEHTSELQSRPHLVCRLLLEKKKKKKITTK